ncbi:MAG TPA: hypothetical protein VI874_05510, partial [Candidatus Norongarragalinales archaeon]|nr:hypothetical protein [Candidatus Norongarragalinales archaeon]
MRQGAPTAFSPTAFFSLIWELVHSTGAVPRAGQSGEDFVRKSLTGMSIAVVGTRAGLLQKMLEHYGASTYGLDVDAEAIRIAKSRGLDAECVSAEKINKVFAGRTPNRVVSYYFLAPHYWQETDKKFEFNRVVRALHEHSSDETVHIHQTVGVPLEMPGFR